MKVSKVILSAMLSMPVSSQLLATERESGGRMAPLAVEVVFSSPGNGIYSEGVDQVLELATNKLKSGDAVQINGKHWGREGEFTVCVQFATFNAAYKFENEVKPIVESDPSSIQRTTATRILSCNKNLVIPPNV